MALQIWMPLNGNIDNHGLRGDIIPQMMGNGVTFVDGKTGKAANFPNNPDSCLYMTGMELQTGTWCAWIKVLGEGASSSQRIISEGRDYSSIGTNFYVNKAGTTLFFQSHKQALAKSIPLNTWIHIAGIFGDGEITLYINGNKVSSIAYTEDTDYYYSNGELVLGKMSYSRALTTNYFPFNGQICDFRVYDNALSANEIYEIAKGLILHYPLSREGMGCDNLIKGNFSCVTTSSSHTTSGSATIPNGTSILMANHGKTLWFSFDYSAEGARNNNTGRSGASLAMRYGAHLSFNYTDTSGVVHQHYPCASYLNKTDTGHAVQSWIIPSDIQTANSFTVTLQPFASPADGNDATWYLKNFKIEIGDEPTPWVPHKEDSLYDQLGLDDNVVYDVSGYEHNATMINPTLLDYSTTTRKYNVGLLFKRKSTTNSITEVGYLQYSNFYMPDEFTISYWWYYDSSLRLVGNPPSCFGYGTSDGYNKNGIHNYDTKICINTAPFGSEQNVGRKEIAISYADKAWSHIAATFDGITLTVYVNGVVRGSITTGQSEKYHIIRSDGNLFIGVDRAGGLTRGASGCLQDFRIYATALSAADVAKLYNGTI